MHQMDTCCTLVPYFRVEDGKQEAFRALGTRFIDRTRSEPGCLHYAFSFSDSLAHCREGYEDAAALLAHLDNVSDLLEEALTMAELVRLEVHAPPDELGKLRAPLAPFEPQFFTLGEGFRRDGAP